MKLVYEAGNAIEAHMVLNMLEQDGIHGRIDGEFLQGAIGDLPAGGSVRVMAPDEQFEAARALVTAWDAAQPTTEAAPASTLAPQRLNVWTFAAGLAIGVLLTYAYFQGPAAPCPLN